MAEQKTLIDELIESLAALEAEMQRVKKENAELSRRLELNSQNSHQPPGSDGYRKETVRPTIPKGEKRAPGGKPGHKGKTLRIVEKPDKVVAHLPENCTVCGREIRAE